MFDEYDVVIELLFGEYREDPDLSDLEEFDAMNQ